MQIKPASGHVCVVFIAKLTRHVITASKTTWACKPERVITQIRTCGDTKRDGDHIDPEHANHGKPKL